MEKLANAKEMAWRNGHNLSLETKKDVLEFADVPCDEESSDVSECRHHELLEYFEHQDAFLVEIGFYEGSEFLLIDRQTGQRISLAWQPIFSPSGTRLIAAGGENLDGAHYQPNRISIWKRFDVQEGYRYWSNELSMDFSDDLYVCVVGWLSDQEIELRGTKAFWKPAGPTNVEFPVRATWDQWWILKGKPPQDSGPITAHAPIIAFHP